MAREEKTYRVYATLDHYVYTDIKTTSPHKARFLAGQIRQDWHPSSELEDLGEPIEPLPRILGVEQLED